MFSKQKTGMKLCPFIRKACIGDECAMYTSVRGYDSNSGAEIDAKECALALLPLLSINTANEARKAAAATESLRNTIFSLASPSKALPK